MGSAVAAPGLYSTGSKLWCMGLVALRCGNRPGLGTDPVSPALAGRFLTPEPCGKPSLRVWEPCVTDGMHAELLYLCPTLRPYGLQPAKLFCPWDAPGRNTGAGCHALLQGIFPTQGSNPHLLRLLHCRWILYRRATEEAVTVSLLPCKAGCPLGRELTCSAQHIAGALNCPLLKNSLCCTGRAAPEAAKL